jgi:hypothetical protein
MTKYSVSGSQFSVTASSLNREPENRELTLQSGQFVPKQLPCLPRLYFK